MTTREAPWPYDLPIWRSAHRAAAPDGSRGAEIDPAWEVSMGNPSSGLLSVSCGLRIPRCNPSFLWSDDSRFLAVPRFFERLGVFRRQRLLVIDFREQRIHASQATAHYFQPESFAAGRLVVSIEPFRSKRMVEFRIPYDLERSFRVDSRIPWPAPPS